MTMPNLPGAGLVNSGAHLAERLPWLIPAAVVGYGAYLLANHTQQPPNCAEAVTSQEMRDGNADRRDSRCCTRPSPDNPQRNCPSLP